jgi:hypothetical protein
MNKGGWFPNSPDSAALYACVWIGRDDAARKKSPEGLENAQALAQGRPDRVIWLALQLLTLANSAPT